MPRPDRPPTPSARLPRSIDRADVAAIVERCREILAESPTADVDCEDLVDPKLPAVAVLAELSLAARRSRRQLRLEHAGPDLLDLLAFCGLAVSDADDAN